MKLDLEPYSVQNTIWPSNGRHILAQFDNETVVVYQAYRPSIGRFVAEHGYFGGEFGFNRMSWVKPNFLWMMYRSGWGTKPDQEITLAVRIRRAGFDAMLQQAVHSSFNPTVYADEAAWRHAVAGSSVRLQWDPDHDPCGHPLERRAIQLGLRGAILRSYGTEWIVDVEDVSDFAAEQRANASQHGYPNLLMPRERVYPIPDMVTAARIGIQSPDREVMS